MTADESVVQKALGGHRPPLQGASFDSIARFYETLERIAFGNALQRARVAFLDQASVSSRALIVGEGNGRFLAEKLRTNAKLEINCVDSSSEMLRLAQKRSSIFLRSTRRDILRFHHSDILCWQPKQRNYDLIVTHFFLDCFDRNDLPMEIDKIDSVAAPDAQWLITDFSLPENGFARGHARIWLRAMYSFFRLAANLQTRELVSFAPLLRARGFRLRARRDWRFGLISAQLWQR